MGNYFDIWLIFGGLAIFLYGMGIFEDVVKQLASKSFKQILEKFTNTRFKSITAGVVVTGILQSSTAVSLLVLALVGAGMIGLSNGIGIVLGANIGTTFTEALVGVIGIKFDLSDIAFPAIAVGGILKLLFRNNIRIMYWSKCLLGFGFIFLGLVYMKDAVLHLKDSLDLGQFMAYGPFVYYGIGLISAIVLNSSSAVTIITLTALNAGVIDLPLAVAVLLGSYLGTTSTAVLGSLGGGYIKKQVALSHVLFNVIGSIIGGVLFIPIIYILENIPFFGGDDVLLLSFFHIVYKLCIVILLFPFLNHFKDLIVYLVPNHTKKISLHIEQLPLDGGESEANSIALGADCVFLLKQVMSYNLAMFDIDDKILLHTKIGDKELETYRKVYSKDELKNLYQNIKHVSDSMIEFILRTKNIASSSNSIMQLHTFSLVVSQFGYSSKCLKEVRHDIIHFRESEVIFIHQLYQTLRKNYAFFCQQIFQLIDGNSFDIHPGLLDDLSMFIKQENESFLNSLNHDIHKKISEELQITTIINTNTLIIQSYESLVAALQNVIDINKNR